MVGVTGLLVVVAGAQGRLPRLELGPTESGGLLVARSLFSAIGLVGMLLLTAWPVAGLFGAIGGFLLPTFRRSKQHRKEAVERIEAIAVWAETLRDTMAASAGIHEAIRLSARVAPAPIRDEVRNLVLRMQHQPVAIALRRFAADLAHPISDAVVAALILATTRQAGSLQSVLAITAKGARDSATQWRQVEGRRARTYSQARLAGWTSAVVILFLIVFRRSFLEPYDSVGGQIALVVVGTIFLLSGLALYLLSQPVRARRVFQGIESWAGATEARMEVRR